MPQEQDDAASKFPTIGDDYKIFEKLGEGAYGEVYKAHHDLLQQDFAVKLLRPELCEDEDVRARFLDEARALIRFSHPNVVQVRHVGEFKGRLFLVMDFMKGEELGQLMSREGALPEDRALSLVKQMLAGLEAAHAAGIVHRDLKPSNIMVEKSEDGTDKIKILDFGLSKFSAVDGEKGAHRSITGTIVGTLAYMSPEQIKGEKDIDGRSDLFAIGLILQEMLQGHHPYPGDSGIVVAAKLLRDPIPPMQGKSADGVSDDTKSALARALERDRDARFPSVMAFSQSLEGRGPPSDTSRVTTIQEAQQELARQEAETARKAREKKSKGRSKMLVAAIAFCAMAAVSWLLFDQKDEGGGKNAAKKTVVAKGARITPTPLPPPDPVPSPVPSPLPTPDPVPSPVPSPLPDPDPVPSPEPKPLPDPDPVPSPKPQPIPDPDPVPQPDPAPQTVPDPQPDPEPQPDPAAAGTPAELIASARPLLAAGAWAEARQLLQRAAANSPPTGDLQLEAMRSAAEAWHEEADALARSGRIDEALDQLTQAGAWLKSRHKTYSDLPQAAQVARLPLGFARMHQAEAHVERARWLRVQGDAAGAGDAMKQAEGAYDFALDQLRRDGVRYWEFLVRRAEMYRLQGKSDEMIADVSHTTKTKDAKVPAHMWVAHARAARRVAQAYSDQGKADEARNWAKQALKVAEDGVGWQDGKLSRRQWLEMARVLFVVAMLQTAGSDPTALHGKIRYWVGEAADNKPAPWVDADVANARLLTGRAMERTLQGMVLVHRQKAADADIAFGEAATRLTEAIALRESAAKRGVRLADSLPYEVRAALAMAQGRDEQATAALAAAREAAARNPD